MSKARRNPSHTFDYDFSAWWEVYQLDTNELAQSILEVDALKLLTLDESKYWRGRYDSKKEGKLSKKAGKLSDELYAVLDDIMPERVREHLFERNFSAWWKLYQDTNQSAQSIPKETALKLLTPSENVYLRGLYDSKKAGNPSDKLYEELDDIMPERVREYLFDRSFSAWLDGYKNSNPLAQKISKETALNLLMDSESDSLRQYCKPDKVDSRFYTKLGVVMPDRLTKYLAETPSNPPQVFIDWFNGGLDSLMPDIRKCKWCDKEKFVNISHIICSNGVGAIDRAYLKEQGPMTAQKMWAIKDKPNFDKFAELCRLLVYVCGTVKGSSPSADGKLNPVIENYLLRVTDILESMHMNTVVGACAALYKRQTNDTSVIVAPDKWRKLQVRLANQQRQEIPANQRRFVVPPLPARRESFRKSLKMSQLEGGKESGKDVVPKEKSLM